MRASASKLGNVATRLALSFGARYVGVWVVRSSQCMQAIPCHRADTKKSPTLSLQLCLEHGINKNGMLEEFATQVCC